VNFAPFGSFILPSIQHLEAINKSSWSSINDRAGCGDFALVSKGSEFDIFDFLRTLFHYKAIEDIEEVVVVENAEFVAGFDKAYEAAGFSTFGVSEEEELGELLGFVLGEGGHVRCSGIPW